MPIARVAGKLIHFAHVPRCAGTSVELYLERRFGPLAFRDPAFGDGAGRWSRTSPQHIAAADLARLFPEGFFDASFAVVRHPAARLQSVYLFQRDIEGRIGRTVSFAAWLKQVAGAPERFDNHARPMDDLVPQGATFFRFEEGLDRLVDWLDQKAGATAPDLVFPKKNGYATRMAWAGRAPGPVPRLTPAAADRIAGTYGRDFDRFGYDPDPESWGRRAGT
ncbi:MAG: sulfotransferase family 2 domain-containing protein [Marinibacterium sp.]